jgi:general nucleoside transport system permease protein
MIDALLLAVVAATPLLLAVEGEVVVQRSGIINLGLEGMMLSAAMTSVVAAQLTQSATIGFLGGVIGAAIIAAIFGIFVIGLRSDQIVTGTAINLLALGATSVIYRELQHSAIFTAAVPRVDHDWITPAAWLILPLVLGFVVWRTRFGLRLRACGENPEAVTAAGASVDVHRWIALGIEALLAGIGGADLALALSSGFAENMVSGRGFIALAIVIFGRWKFKGAVLGSAVFGMAAAAQYAIQASGRGLPFHLLLAVPYVVTLLILCGIAGRVRAPEALGR